MCANFFSTTLLIVAAAAHSHSLNAQEVFQGRSVQTSSEYTAALNRLFSSVTVVSLDVSRLHAVVRSHPERSEFTLDFGEGQRYAIELHEHDLRSPDYIAQQTGPTGLVTLERTPCVTYAGHLIGDEAKRVRLNIEPHRIWGHLRTDRGLVHLEPLKNIIPEAPEAMHVLYEGKAVIGSGGLECGAVADPDVIAPRSDGSGEVLRMSGDDCRKLDIATESDWEFYDGDQTFADIQGNLNLVEDIYYDYFDMAFQIRYQHQWTTSSDPYTNNLSGCSDNGQLDHFKDYWRENFGHIRRDISVLYTEKDYEGGTIGCAYVGVFGNGVTNNAPGGVAGSQGAYSVNMWLDDIIHVQAHRTQLVAHEMGHNFGATHDESNCGIVESGNIMCGSGYWTNLDFLPTAITQIEAGMNYVTNNVEHDGRRALRERHVPANVLGTFAMEVSSGIQGNVVIVDRPCLFATTTSGQFTFGASESVKLLPGFTTSALANRNVHMFAGAACLLFQP